MKIKIEAKESTEKHAVGVWLTPPNRLNNREWKPADLRFYQSIFCQWRAVLAPQSLPSLQ